MAAKKIDQNTEQSITDPAAKYRREVAELWQSWENDTDDICQYCRRDGLERMVIASRATTLEAALTQLVQLPTKIALMEEGIDDRIKKDSREDAEFNVASVMLAFEDNTGLDRDDFGGAACCPRGRCQGGTNG